ncbi:MAG: aminomethyl-transferring glycine dehydrogenase [Actinobacteria bacterium]|uniref:glycine dehydrogenase (aminomethyl-transferring) n=1 Tax=freshwater metagenome TaxID=449393 RepID=A0A6J6EQP7_9ZZZZ|nr:aminomethyl-transferring glycine dehydrogenase [Actinomycetota bacterium]
MGAGFTTRGRSFADRHIGPTQPEIDVMLNELGYQSLDQLLEAVVPGAIRWQESLDLPAAVSEAQVLDDLRSLANRNQINRSLIGLGYYNTFTPTVILRNVLENPAWYTAYTPYQPEIAQGRLEALINFQTTVQDLTGLPIANASMLDEATAAAEAMTLARRNTKVESNVFVIDQDTHPQTIEVIRTRANPLGIEIKLVDLAKPINSDYFGLLISYPASSGNIYDLTEIVAAAHSAGALVAVATDLLALTLLKSPGEFDADIAIGSAQRFGVALGYGGPHAGFMSVKAGLERSLPGRLVGVSVDAAGKPAYRLALQTREQHIRRERATSNICTAQVLLAVMASMYAVYHGPDGLRDIAQRINQYTSLLAAGLTELGAKIVHQHFFDTLRIKTSAAAAWQHRLTEKNINVLLVDNETIGISIDETVDLATLTILLETYSQAQIDMDQLWLKLASHIPAEIARTSEYLTHRVFHKYQNETAMLRYIKSLADKDYALDRGMIPLGSCTMKLNAATEMQAVTWPQFANLHPFVPIAQADGSYAMIRELENWLVEITGYDAVSLQPNAGSQGEFAGLLAIKKYLEGKGEHNRDVCLIPSSAHGTNAASAVMAGMKVVVVACDDQGNVDLADLTAKIEQHRDALAALMVTYPSTHGVFESAIADICGKIHDAGGQVYVDGANLNALVGVAKPGKFGADVSHLNLHKTFCIPHGGGGPGVGPVAVKSHLAPYLPNHPIIKEAGPDTGVGPISAAPFGSAAILPISWSYIKMMGAEGLLRATSVAILSANYIAKKLDPYFPVLYTGQNDLIAHECIIDLREITKETGITVEDVSKRLMDYGFHAPTVSFPVAGTMMIEPTESEDLAEINRFIAAMISIKAEIDKVASEVWPKEDNPLINAPHTALNIVDEWNHSYSRELAVFPAGNASSKYWVPVQRIDAAYGDRNLVCSCPPPEAFAVN